MKYRKKPVTVEAVQWWKDGDHPMVAPSIASPGAGYLTWARTYVDPGDWIITQDGRHSVVSAEEFAREYEPVKESQ